MFNVADWTVVAVYLIAMLAIGIFSARHQRSTRDYFLGGRSLRWWTVGLSIVATETSALTFIGVPAMAFGTLQIGADGVFFTQGGSLRFMQLIIGYIVARLIVAAIMVPHYFKGDVYTPYQLLRRGFGRGPGTLAAIFSLFSMCLQAGVRVYVTAIPVSIVMRTVFPSWGIWPSIVLFTLAALVYATAGGIRAVVLTDMAQFFLIFFGGLFALFYIPTLLTGDLAAPSGASGWSAFFEIGREKLSFFHWGWVARAPGQGFGAWLVAGVAELTGGPFNIWMGLIGATIGVMASHGADQLNVQRVLACRDVREGRRALWLSAAIIAPQMLVFLLIGVALFVFYTANGFDFGGIDPWDTVSAATKTPKADYVFPIFIVTQLPSVIRGLLFAGVLAAAVSSLTSALTAISSVAIMDLWRPLFLRKQSAKPGSELTYGRWGTVIAGGVLMAVAWWAKDAPLIFNFVFQFAGIVTGAKLGSLLFAQRKRSGDSASLLWAMGSSAAVMATIVTLSRLELLKIRWPWYAAIGTAICYGIAHLLWRDPGAEATRAIDVPASDE